MNKTYYPTLSFLVLFLWCMVSSCSKSSSAPITPVIPVTTTPGVIPANISDYSSGSSGTGLTLTPYSGFPALTSLVSDAITGYYYIVISNGDTITFTIYADSLNSNVAVLGQTSDSGPNYFTSGDSLQFLVTGVQYNGPFGGTGTAYYASDLSSGYSLKGTDTINFSASYLGAQIYSSSIGFNSAYNLYNTQAYIAFRIKNSAGYKYGWMRLSSDPSGGNLLSVYEIAFNNNYNVPIVIGQYK